MRPASLHISSEEYHQRIEKLINNLKSEDYSGVVIFDSYYIQYYSGFAFIPTERPIALLVNRDAESILFIPRLELEHAQTNAVVTDVIYYLEYPSMPHPMEILVALMKKTKFDQHYGADNDGYPWILGYRGPSLSELTGYVPKKIAINIEQQMMVKSQSEINLIRESVKWGHLAHTLLQRYTSVGLTETKVSQMASAEATLAMLDTIGPIYRAQSPFSRGASAGYRGQIGRNAAIPHALASNITFQPGDVLVTGAGAPIWGYNSELERTMLIGPPNARQKTFFEHMLNLQNLAFETMGPGVPCSQVDLSVRAYYEDHELMDNWKHHVGHAIGLRYHEAPFLDLGDSTLMEPGMVFTVEPGLYVPDLGGFRHSDTVLVTESGVEILTYYPRDIDSLTIAV